MIATFAAASLLLAPVPPAQAFTLPPVRRCVSARALSFRVERAWRTVTVRVDGKRFKRVTRPGRVIRLRKLPAARFVLQVDARAKDGRRATVTRTYHPCAPNAEPTVSIPDGAPPSTLMTRDLIPGTGARARKGMTVSVRYTLTAWSSREKVDSSWSRRERFAFPLGTGAVIKGFDQGIAGMRLGGRRELIVPPGLGYGAAGSPPAVAPNETLVFVVDLVEVKS